MDNELTLKFWITKLQQLSSLMYVCLFVNFEKESLNLYYIILEELLGCTN